MVSPDTAPAVYLNGIPDGNDLPDGVDHHVDSVIGDPAGIEISDFDASVIDPDPADDTGVSAHIAELTAKIAVVYARNQEYLIVSAAGHTIADNHGLFIDGENTDTLIVSGSASDTVYQDLLREIRYVNIESGPYIPTDDRTVNVQVQDGVGAESNIATATISILTGNHAPRLDPNVSPQLAAVNEDAGLPSGTVGTPVSSLVDLAVPVGQNDNVTDADAGDPLGIAVTVADTSNGAWYYSIDGGGSWSALGAVSDSSARLLAANANDRLYFRPSADFNGTISAALTFRASDQTSGTEGVLASTSPNGGTSAFSTRTEDASIVVNAVNDAPVLAGIESAGLPYSAGNPAGYVTATTTVTDIDSTDFDTGTLQVDMSVNGYIDDQIAIANQGTSPGQIGIAGPNVSYGPTLIGTWMGGSGTTLVVTLNANATPTAVQALVRAITYRSVIPNPTPGIRTIRFVLTDGDGGTSAPATRDIDVLTPA
jgi:hypothetical protein